MEAYITYFDLLGTKGFCDSPNVYFTNICAFREAITDAAWILKDYGNVGVFSDSAYAESSDLEFLLQFLVQVRNRLISKNLFFNAVVKKGSLGVEPLDSSAGTVAFGVAFTKNDIADLYISQTNFKGIGILIDKSIYDEVINTSSFSVNNCIFVQRIQNNDSIKYQAVPYYDIAFKDEPSSKKHIERILKIVIRNMYSAYLKSPKFGLYYISLLSNLIRSYPQGFKWDITEHTFNTSPYIFAALHKMIRDYATDLSDLPCLEYLALIMLDVIYNTSDLTETQKNDITSVFIKYDCIRNKYIHALNDIPHSLFSYNNELCCNNRDLFIKYCQEEMSNSFVNNILG